jgi:hypothetical protein
MPHSRHITRRQLTSAWCHLRTYDRGLPRVGPKRQTMVSVDTFASAGRDDVEMISRTTVISKIHAELPRQHSRARLNE